MKKLLPFLPYALIIGAVVGICFQVSASNKLAGANALRIEQADSAAGYWKRQAIYHRVHSDSLAAVVKEQDVALKEKTKNFQVKSTAYRVVRDTIDLTDTAATAEVLEMADEALGEAARYIEQAQHAIAARDSLIASLRGEISAKDRQIEALDNLNKTLKSEIRRRKADKLFTYIKGAAVGAGAYAVWKR